MGDTFRKRKSEFQATQGVCQIAYNVNAATCRRFGPETSLLMRQLRLERAVHAFNFACDYSIDCIQFLRQSAPHRKALCRSHTIPEDRHEPSRNRARCHQRDRQRGRDRRALPRRLDGAGSGNGRTLHRAGPARSPSRAAASSAIRARRRPSMRAATSGSRSGWSAATWCRATARPSSTIWARSTASGRTARPFEGNRYVDRFVVRGGKIVQMDVWNDSAERLLDPQRHRRLALTSPRSSVARGSLGVSQHRPYPRVADAAYDPVAPLTEGRSMEASTL